MQFTLRDIIYLSVYVTTVAVLFAKYKFKINQVSKNVDVIKNIIFLEKGGLNIVDNVSCTNHRKLVDESIQREAAMRKDAVAQIRHLNTNVTRLMIHLKVEPVEFNANDKI